MNVFILSRDLQENVESHVDSHVVKLILEAAQIASTVHWLKGGRGPYRPTHTGHPLVKWALASKMAYRFVVRYGLALCEEFTYRFGKTHKTQAVLEWLRDNEPDLEDIPSCYCIVTAPDCRYRGDEVRSYREYYLKHKRHLFRWTKRGVPEWIQSN